MRRSGRLRAVNRRGSQEEAGANLPKVVGVVAPALAGVAATALRGAEQHPRRGEATALLFLGQSARLYYSITMFIGIIS